MNKQTIACPFDPIQNGRNLSRRAESIRSHMSCALAILLIAFFLTAPKAMARTTLSAGSGSIEFVATVKSKSISFLKPQTVLRGTSGDGSERFEAKVSGTDLIVIRDVRPCLRLSARVQNAMKDGAPQKISLRWNGASASVSVGGRPEEPLDPSLTDELPRFAPIAFVVGSQDVEVRYLELDHMPLLSESSADRRFAEQSKCFNPAVVKSAAQESYRGLELRGISDADQLVQAKRWIDGMTPAMLAVVKRVTVSSEGAQTWRGQALVGSLGSILLRPEALAGPNVFFHEGAHLLDAAHGWRDSKDWGTLFMGLPPGSRSFSSGAVGHMDASAPGEQLAEFVGRTHEETLGYASSKICSHESACSEKMDFLAARGYIFQADVRMLSSLKIPLAAQPRASIAARVTSKAPTQRPSYKTEIIVPPSGASAIDIFIDSRFFRPIDIYRDARLVVNPTWRGCKAEDVMNRLTKRRPSAILSEPRLNGVSRSYGYFDFGIKKSNKYYFALDEKADGSIEMLFDMNRNGRLDDDGPARPSIGKFKDGGKGYATLLEIPWADMTNNPPWAENFKLWFMANPFEWAIAGFSKSSRTQLIGSIELSEQMYEIILADTAHSDNDGDMSNDGVCLRKSGQKVVCYSEAEARAGVAIDGRRYTFKVRYR